MAEKIITKKSANLHICKEEEPNTDVNCGLMDWVYYVIDTWASVIGVAFGLPFF